MSKPFQIPTGRTKIPSLPGVQLNTKGTGRSGGLQLPPRSSTAPIHFPAVTSIQATPQTTSSSPQSAAAAAAHDSPRGRNHYPAMRRTWNMNTIVSWSGLCLSFFSLVLVAILYFNWSGGPLTAARDESKRGVSGGVQEIEQEVAFLLKADPGQFVRWPEVGSIVKGLDMSKLTGTRLCCRVGGRYFVCDYGQGGTENIGIECFVEYLKEEGGSHLLINIQSSQMNGADCVFRWSQQPETK